MKPLLIALLLTCLTLTSVSADTNEQPLVHFLLLHSAPKSTNVVDSAWVRLRLERSPVEQSDREKMSEPQSIKPPLLTVSQSPRLARVAATNYDNPFQVLAQLPGLFNFNSVYTKIKGDDTLEPSMALQMVLFNFALLNRYDIEWGPAYVLVNGDSYAQLGLTIKFLETPAVQNSVQQSPVKSVMPVDLSKFYFYIGGGCRVDAYQTWSVSLGVGIKVGN